MNEQGLVGSWLAGGTAAGMERARGPCSRQQVHGWPRGPFPTSAAVAAHRDGAMAGDAGGRQPHRGDEHDSGEGRRRQASLQSAAAW